MICLLYASPLYKVEELEKSPLYTVLCGGKELTVYHTDSFDYVIPVVDDDSPLSFQVKVSKDFQKAVFRPAKTNVQAQDVYKRQVLRDEVVHERG